MALRTEPTPSNRRDRPNQVLAGCFLLGITVVAYVPALQGGYIWDDDKYVTENWTLHSIDGLKAIWARPQATPQYYPSVFTTFWAEYHLWGLRPFEHHLVNVLLHAVSAILLWRLLRRLSVPGAYLAGALFALHPVHVESVAWVTERKNVLSGFFYLAAAISYFRFRPVPTMDVPSERTPAQSSSPGVDTGTNHWAWYSLATLLFVCALLSKTVTATAPAAILLVFWWKSGRLQVRDAAPLVPWFLIGILLGLLTAWLERHHVGAVGVQWELSFLERCLVAGRAVWFYLAKIVWPVHLCFVYPRWHIDANAYWQYLFPIAVMAGAAALFLGRARMGQGPFVALAYFIGTLFPALGFFDIYPMQFSFVADHFQYHATISMMALAGAGFHRLCYRPYASAQTQRDAKQTRHHPAVLPVAAVAMLLLALTVATWRQAGNYRDEETLWRATLAENPTAWLAQANLGLVLIGKGAANEAFELLDAARRAGADNAQVRLAYAYALVQTGSLNEAFVELTDFLTDRPASAYAHALLGAVEARRGNIDNAVRHYREAIYLAPDMRVARLELAFMLLQEGRPEDAVREYQELLADDPQNTTARMGLSEALRASGRSDAAKVKRRRATEAEDTGTVHPE